ncbi:MAG TPA: ABC transporter ATP-binding protein, partial [Chloroflexota bacterium]
MSIPIGAYYALLATYLRVQRRRVALLAVLMLASIVLQVANPQVVRAFIDAVSSPTTSSEYLTRLAALFIGVALVQEGFAIASTYVSERVGWTATNTLREDLVLHCLRLDQSFFKTRTPGELIERIDGDVTALASFFTQFVINLCGNALLMFGVLIVLWFQDWQAGLPLTAFVVLTVLGLGRLRAVAVPAWATARQASAELFGFLEEALLGTEDVRASGATPYVMRRLFGHTRDRYRTARRARLTASVGWNAPAVFFALGIGVAFATIAWLYQSHSITLGAAFLIYYYAQLLIQPLERVADQFEEFQKASGGIARVRELLAIRGTLSDGRVDGLPAGPLSVELDRVSFGYDEGEPVLRDVSLRLAPGEVLGLLGRTGSGKTTLARLLFRLYDPDAGALRVGGVDLRQAQRHQLRSRVGMVTQEVQLFRATVRDNLSFFDPSVSDRQLHGALAELGLAEWYAALPRGLDTVLGAEAGLSAGEAQLLAFTRVFLRDPGLIILDEASSRVDPLTEQLIERAVDRLLANRTGVIIAHRLATVGRADTILILDDGAILE